MALTVSISHPQFPDDVEFGVAGAFVVPNGGSAEITEEQERDFAAARGVTIQDALGNSEVFEVSGDPTLTDLKEVLSEQALRDIEETPKEALGIKSEEALSEEKAAQLATEEGEATDTSEQTTQVTPPQEDKQAAQGGEQ